MLSKLRLESSMLRAAIFLLFALLYGCDSDIPSTEYYPLQSGVTWEYRVMTNLAGKEDIRSYRVENRGEVALSNEYSDEIVKIRHTSDGTDYYILQDDTGSYRIAERSIIEYEPRFEPERVRILPSLEDIEVGRTWAIVTKPYALHRTSSSSLPDPSEQSLNMLFDIKSLNDEVTVPAGTFENCLRVEGSAIVSLYTDPRIGYQDIEISQIEWYAPGVGLVKFIRDEPLDMPLFKGGKITFELTSFDH